MKKTQNPKNLEELIEEIEKEFDRIANLDVNSLDVNGVPVCDMDIKYSEIKSFLRQALFRVARETARAGEVRKYTNQDIRAIGKSWVGHPCMGFIEAVNKQQKQLKEFLGD